MKIRSVFLFYLLVILLSSWILSSCQEKSTDIFDTAPYKYPRLVVFRDELPKTTSGKIQRNKL